MTKSPSTPGAFSLEPLRDDADVPPPLALDDGRAVLVYPERVDPAPVHRPRAVLAGSRATTPPSPRNRFAGPLLLLMRDARYNTLHRASTGTAL